MSDPRRKNKKNPEDETLEEGHPKDRRIPAKADEQEIELIENPVFDDYVIETVPMDSDADGEEDTEEVETVEEELPEPTPEEKKADEVIAELHDRNMRLQAEFDNFRKRQAREFSRLCNQGKKELMSNLLDVLDNFDRAYKHKEDDEHKIDDIAEGMFRTIDQLKGVMEREGLQILEIKEKEPFDPEIHDALYAEEIEGLEEEIVLEVLQNGYILNEELLRPARVRVGKVPEVQNDGEDTPE